MQSISLRQTIRTPNFRLPCDPHRFGILFLAFIVSLLGYTQQKCGTIAPTSGEFENWISDKLKSKVSRPSERTQQSSIYQIPVVVHIFHKGEPVGTGTNLSEERIIGQIDSLNADFRRQNADAENTPLDFLPVAADSEIEFVLAKRDPNGQPTNGILRIEGEQSTYRVTSDQITMRAQSHWPPQHYLNIYVADLQLFIGYATFPVTDLEGIFNESDDFLLDAVFVDYMYFGNNPSSPNFESLGRTLTHEIGHFLGLRHIWGDAGCSGDDFVEDTPTARISHEGVTSPCTYPIPDDPDTPSFDDGNTCTEEDDPDIPDMFQNYMDYTDDVCMNLFTIGQKQRMRTVLENSPRRASLLTSPALTEPERADVDLAATKIIHPDAAECDGQITPTFLVTNLGLSEITSFDAKLFINDVNVSSVSISTSLMPFMTETVSFSNQIIGTAPTTVAFTISNVNEDEDESFGNNTIAVTIAEISSGSLPYRLDFEASENLLGEVGSSSVWEVVNAPKETPDNNALVFKSYQNNQSFDEETILTTPPLDLNGVPSAALSFSYAYAGVPNGLQDGLIVRASIDCGETYPDLLFEAVGPDLETSLPTEVEFVPINQLQWRDTTLGISSYRNLDDVRFLFQGLNGGSNNFYIDNILIEETNLLANDISLQAINGPLVTCDEQVSLQLQIRNAGSSPVTSFKIDFVLNGETFSQTISGLNLAEREYASFPLNVALAGDSDNNILVNVTEVNGEEDLSAFGNSIEYFINVDFSEDEYPLVLDFESDDQWINTTPNEVSIWERTTVGQNGVLRANAFNEEVLGTQSWFISPSLSTGGLDSAGLYFRLSYAGRTGFNDRLRVLASVNCGATYTITLLDAYSDSLAIAEADNKWIPSSDDDWKEFRLNLSNTIPFEDDIRIAFVFINGNGNDLYIDDIRIQSNDPPDYEDIFRLYPNPTKGAVFHLGLNLTEKKQVKVELIDMSGKTIIVQTIPNALNQIIPFEAPYHPGLYLVRVSGDNFAQTQRLFVNPN